jgi:hypothetical protein
MRHIGADFAAPVHRHDALGVPYARQPNLPMKKSLKTKVSRMLVPLCIPLVLLTLLYVLYKGVMCFVAQGDFWSSFHTLELFYGMNNGPKSVTLLLQACVLCTCFVCMYVLWCADEDSNKMSRSTRRFRARVAGQLLLVLVVVAMFIVFSENAGCENMKSGWSCTHMLWQASTTPFPSPDSIRGTKNCKEHIKSMFGTESCPASQDSKDQHVSSKMFYSACNFDSCSQNSTFWLSRCNCTDVIRLHEMHLNCTEEVKTFFNPERVFKKKAGDVSDYALVVAILSSMFAMLSGFTRKKVGMLRAILVLFILICVPLIFVEMIQYTAGEMLISSLGKTTSDFMKSSKKSVCFLKDIHPVCFDKPGANTWLYWFLKNAEELRQASKFLTISVATLLALKLQRGINEIDQVLQNLVGVVVWYLACMIASHVPNLFSQKNATKVTRGEYTEAMSLMIHPAVSLIFIRTCTKVVFNVAEWNLLQETKLGEMGSFPVVHVVFLCLTFWMLTHGNRGWMPSSWLVLTADLCIIVYLNTSVWAQFLGLVEKHAADCFA